MKNEDQARSLFGISLSDRPKWHQFLICSSGFFFGYLVNGVCEMEMLFCSTVVGLPFLLAPMILTGELFRAWNSCSQHPYVYGVLVFEAMATFVGQVSVLSLIAIFGAATTAMITTARKAVTLLLSYLIFTKPLTEQHGTGLLLIAMGIILKMLPENKAPSRTLNSYTVAKNRKSSLQVEKMSAENEEDDEKRPFV
ncbi:hypothetical protein Pint_16037 [Pistacia integerrima]|uniref:Uncharacterized protein n=1 Tax=Pistacia integerrima TaxID=434235 RepID=A0ACC0ZAX3_9ROSI|nr:hypothetical protein Pint_16037 [Pistacia integerrima]